jgi:hypothetical protein
MTKKNHCTNFVRKYPIASFNTKVKYDTFDLVRHSLCNNNSMKNISELELKNCTKTKSTRTKETENKQDLVYYKLSNEENFTLILY